MAQKIVDFIQRPDDELTMRCNCGADHFLSFMLHRRLFGEEDDDVYLHLTEPWRTPRGLWGRIKAALVIFFRGEYHSAEIGLNAGDLMAISKWCDSRLKENGNLTGTTAFVGLTVDSDGG